jgi:hypothetical protein
VIGTEQEKKSDWTFKWSRISRKFPLKLVSRDVASGSAQKKAKFGSDLVSNIRKKGLIHSRIGRRIWVQFTYRKEDLVQNILATLRDYS